MMFFLYNLYKMYKMCHFVPSYSFGKCAVTINFYIIFEHISILIRFGKVWTNYIVFHLDSYTKSVYIFWILSSLNLHLYLYCNSSFVDVSCIQHLNWCTFVDGNNQIQRPIDLVWPQYKWYTHIVFIYFKALGCTVLLLKKIYS